MILKISYWLLALIVACPSLMEAHGDLHERIEAVSKEIKSNPDSAFLYLKRGELYYQHEDYKKALRDFTKSKKLKYKDVRLEYDLASTQYRLGKNDKSINILNIILDEDKFHVKSHRLKGQILFEQGKYEASARAFEQVIEYAEKFLPENFIETSMAWEELDTDDSRCQAKDAIYAGIQNIGPLRIFYDRLIELNKKSGDLEKVIEYQTVIISQLQRKERAYFHRAQTYIEIGDDERAKGDLIMAQKSITLLNNRIRKQQIIRELESSIDELFNSYSTKKKN